MMPIVWTIPGVNLAIPGYGLMMMIGMLLSILWAVKRAERSGANPDVVLNCGFIAIFGGVAGGRLMYVIQYWNQFAHRGSPLDVVWAMLDVSKGGLEVYGGFIAVTVFTLLYLWRYKHSIRWYLDIMAPSAALGMGIGRLGCFLNGCCFGGVCELPWAVEFPYGSSALHQQWKEQRSGAAVPQQLLIFGSEGSFQSGEVAALIPREVLSVTEAGLEKSRAALRERLQEREAARVALQAAENEQARQVALRRIERVDRAIASDPNSIFLTQLQRHNLTLVQLQDLARAHHSLPVHPTQIYSFITLGLLAGVLGAAYWQRRADGQIICLFLLIEPWTRFTLELLRADNPQYGRLTASQYIALTLSVVGLLGLIALRYTRPRSPLAVAYVPESEKKARAPQATG
ncbi:MAG: prolipoprotein diacylglyceryl transferase [Phycisphaerales bacterium]|nr:prolipoprotein diacylglyceryl transferase [Phycisphaerales bacterium]